MKKPTGMRIDRCGLQIVLLLIFSSPIITIAQEPLPTADSVQLLQEVTVKGFAQNRRMIEVPAAISFIDQRKLSRFGNSGIVPVINAQAGTRLEERSPGSYRLNIRGSSLRSPFGVRNVKIYYNDIPYTDPGGNTYLSMIGFYTIENMEIWKGPASSMYGAGTGGVLLLETNKPGDNLVRADLHAGSYGLLHYQLKAKLSDSIFHQQLSFQQLKSDGYRDHTNMDRKVLTWDGTARTGKHGQLSAHIMFGDLYYQTPGALNAAQYALNRRSARPAAGIFPSAQDAASAFNIRSIITGINYQHAFNDNWNISATAYGAYSKVKNPTIRNYEIRNEPHAGTRLLNTVSGAGAIKWKWIIGGELQEGNSTIRIADNDKGTPAALQTEDEADQLQYFLFSQLNFEFNKGWIIDGGLSWNKSVVGITRLSALPVNKLERTYKNEIAPRISLLKKFGQRNTVYSTVSRGFSPPTTAEILPSTGVIATSLEAESGINYELGWKTSFAGQRVLFNVAGYYFKLDNTIAQRRDSAGADYFVNAGSTKQLGIEADLELRLIRNNIGFTRELNGWATYTLNKFTYEEYQKDDIDLSGRELPGIAPNVFAAGIDLSTSIGFYSNISYYYSDRMYLNDANNATGEAYQLLTGKIGIKRKLSNRLTLDVNAVVENIFDEEYVSGFDINAAAGRYYNASAGRNLIVGASLVIDMRKGK